MPFLSQRLANTKLISMRRMSFCSFFFVTLFACGVNAQAGTLTSLSNKMTAAMSDLPRYEKLPLFNPHRKSFTCIYQDQHVPAIDPQAESWFQQALALENFDVYYKDRDYPKIYRLYEQAAERNHWKSMLNLASLILSDYPGIPNHDPEVAIRWVEKAMLLGVPDAYDMMGTYHQNGMIKGGDATSAYGFFQKAADMGSPSAMTFLGYKMAGTYDDPDGEFWGNLDIGTKMLECAVAQGYGDAAAKLGFIYARPNTSEAKARALRVLQEGVKLGSSDSANSLFTEFDGFNLTNGRNLVGFIDRSRAERYSKIGDMLEHYQGRLKLPNLDKVLPLPPAPLPKWNGDTKTLIDAAKAVTPPLKPQPGASRQSREAMPDGHGVLPLAQSPRSITGDQLVPETGYWLALYGPSLTPKLKLQPARSSFPEFYRTGERFEPASFAWLPADQVQWHFLGEALPRPPHRSVFLSQMVKADFLRQVPEVAQRLQCDGLQRCKQTGMESRVSPDHPLAMLYNRRDQQSFVEMDQPFPDPQDRFLDIAMQDLHWVYLGNPNKESAAPGIRDITL